MGAECTRCGVNVQNSTCRHRDLQCGTKFAFLNGLAPVPSLLGRIPRVPSVNSIGVNLLKRDSM